MHLRLAAPAPAPGRGRRGQPCTGRQGASPRLPSRHWGCSGGPRPRTPTRLCKGLLHPETFTEPFGTVSALVGFRSCQLAHVLIIRPAHAGTGAASEAGDLGGARAASVQRWHQQPSAQGSGQAARAPRSRERPRRTLRPAPSCAGCCFPGRRTHKVDAAQIRRACAASPPQARVSLRDTRVTARVPAHRCTRNLITLLQLQINSNLVLTLKMNPILC